jgi:hypothetical protein
LTAKNQGNLKKLLENKRPRGAGKSLFEVGAIIRVNGNAQTQRTHF